MVFVAGFVAELADTRFTRLVESFCGTYFMVKSVDGCPCCLSSWFSFVQCLYSMASVA
ncbi:hypothetical protein C0J52_09241 [Blattella germanica]|nr:hypothetical protein C0J52_09241 [Blattella germanica]